MQLDSDYLPLPLLFFFPKSPPASVLTSPSDTSLPLVALFLFLPPLISSAPLCSTPRDTSRRPLVLIFASFPRLEPALPEGCFSNETSPNLERRTLPSHLEQLVGGVVIWFSEYKILKFRGCYKIGDWKRIVIQYIL